METQESLLTRVLLRQLCSGGQAREIREAAGAGLGETARAARVAKGTLSRWERGLQTPRGDAAIRYAQVLAALIEARGD